MKTFNNPLQEACSGFPISACDYNSCSGSHMWPWKLFRKPAMTCTLEKIDQWDRREPEQKFWCRLFFYLPRHPKNLRIYRKYWFTYTALKKSSIRWISVKENTKQFHAYMIFCLARYYFKGRRNHYKFVKLHFSVKISYQLSLQTVPLNNSKQWTQSDNLHNRWSTPTI